MRFEDMNAMQRRLHNAALVLDGEGDEYGFVGMLREAIEQIERMRTDAERYDFLRARDIDTIANGGVFAGMIPENVVLNGEDLDEALDTAMLKRLNDDSRSITPALDYPQWSVTQSKSALLRIFTGKIWRGFYVQWGKIFRRGLPLRFQQEMSMVLFSTQTKTEEKAEDFRLKFSISNEKYMELSFSPEMAMQIVNSMDANGDPALDQVGSTTIKFGGKDWATILVFDKRLAYEIRDDMEANVLRDVALPSPLQITEYPSGKRKLKKWLAMIRVLCGGAIT